MAPYCHLVAKTRYRDHIDKMTKYVIKQVTPTAAKLYLIITQSRKNKSIYKIAFWDVVMCFFSTKEKTFPTLTKLSISEILWEHCQQYLQKNIEKSISYLQTADAIAQYIITAN